MSDTKLSVDVPDFQRQLENWLERHKKGVAHGLRQQAKALTRDLIKLTPPTGDAPFTESLNEQRDAGRKAITEDVAGLYRNVEDLRIFKNAEEKTRKYIKRYVRSGDAKKLETTLRKMGFRRGVMRYASAIHHKYSRTKNGRADWRKKVVVLRPKTVSQLAKGLHDRVGMAKAGWVSAATKFGVPVPNWIRKHKSASQGEVIDNAEDVRRPSITIINSIPYAQKHTARGKNIVMRALQRREESMRHQLEKIMGKAFSGYGKTFKYAETDNGS